MILVIVLIVLAVLLGLGGVFLTGLKWLLIVAAVLFVAAIIAGFFNRRSSRQI
jgi:hypothetical protein